MKHKTSIHSVAIIVPMHNEDNSAERCVQTIMNELPHISYPSKLFVIDDGSTDQTSPIIKKLQLMYSRKFHVVQHKKNLGYGAAVKTGIRTATQQGFEYGIIMDSDLTNNPKFIHAFVRHIPDGYDLIKASRYIKDSKIIGIPYHRVIISKFGNFIASRLFHIGIQDCTNGFRMIRLSRCKNFPYHETGFASILEELYYLKKTHSTCIEIPTILTARTNSPTHFRYTMGTFWNYLKYALYATQL
ncbi:MAG: glycosyltransferase family 2 protein [Candidatus Gottesmanbacteria bacterium]